MAQSHRRTIDENEIGRFDALAESWWDPDGPMRPLHRLNPLRLRFTRGRLCGHFGRDAAALRPLGGLRLLDVGCGGGLVSEPLARMGAEVVAVDAGPETVAAARRHAEAQGLAIDYRVGTAEALAGSGEAFDAVISMEVVEHVADLDAFLEACSALCRPGGALVLSTLNRTVGAFALAIVAGEYVLRWLPRGTHDWRRFVRPAELARQLRRNGAALQEVKGMRLDPRDGEWRLTRAAPVNYLAFATKA